MVYSMTGFGKGIVQENELIAEAEVKSLNSRFLDLSVKMPRSQSHKELSFREIVKNRIKRGKVTVNLYLKREGLDSRNIFIDSKGLVETIKLVDEIKSAASVKEETRLDHILTFQNLFFTDTTGDEEKEFSLIAEALNKALDDMMSMRAREGEELVNDLNLRLKNISSAVNKIEGMLKDTVKEYFQRLKERAAELVDDLKDYDDRLNMELGLLAEKYDVTEEIVRLKSHVKVFSETLIKEDEVGRKLNFIVQEMNREANTINSKSISSEISYEGIFIKEELEKIREQIQNIE